MDDVALQEQVKDTFEAIIRRAVVVALTSSADQSHVDQATAAANGTLESPSDALLALIDLRIEQVLARVLKDLEIVEEDAPEEAPPPPA